MVQAVGLSSRGTQLWSQGRVEDDEVPCHKGDPVRSRWPVSSIFFFRTAADVLGTNPQGQFGAGLYSSHSVGEGGQGPGSPPARRLRLWAASLGTSGFTARGQSGLREAPASTRTPAADPSHGENRWELMGSHNTFLLSIGFRYSIASVSNYNVSVVSVIDIHSTQKLLTS